MWRPPEAVAKRLLLAAAIAAAGQASVVHAQEGPFGNASLHGTYAFSQITSGADEPMNHRVSAGLVYFDGAGNLHKVFFISNSPADADTDGNPGRIERRTVSDPSTWTYIGTAEPAGRYEVFPSGMFTYTLFSTLDALPTRTEMIDGVLTITEYELYQRTPNLNTGGMAVWKGYRIADGDILPAVPD